MVNLILALLCIGVMVYFVVDNINTNRRQKAYADEEVKHLNRIYTSICFLQDYITDETGWYQVVLRWNNTTNSTSFFTYAKNGYEAVRKIVEKTTGEMNIDYCVTKVIKLAHGC